MKTLALALFTTLITLSTSGQSNSVQGNQGNLYSVALRTSILQMEKDWGDIKNPLIDYRHMVVEKDAALTDALPTEFESHFVEYLDSQGLVERYRKLGRSYPALAIHPIQNEGKILKINVAVHWINYKKGRLQLGLSDWSNVEFQYDCDKQLFVVSSVKLGGI